MHFVDIRSSKVVDFIILSPSSCDVTADGGGGARPLPPTPPACEDGKTDVIDVGLARHRRNLVSNNLEVS